MALHNDDYLQVQQLLIGDGSEWDHFIDRYQRVVFARLRKTSQECQRHLTIADCEDLCAEVFQCLVVNDYSSLRNFRGDSSLGHWLSVITHQRCKKFLYRKSNDPRPSLNAWGNSAEPLADAGSDCTESLMRQEEWEQLMVALGELSPSDQRVVTMFYLQNMSYRLIASRLEISVNSVGPKLSGAIKKLRKRCNQNTKSSLNLESPTNTGTNPAGTRH
ncbi:MAG: sigma-70 family RNA polymerase sigma factor [Planctomycetaceae bacterium]